MRRRSRRTDRAVIIAAAVVFGLGLIAVNAAWPEAFGVIVAIGGTAGALMVLYEVRLTKNIAQAEFIRELQGGFTTDPNIVELWRRLLLNQEITEADRPLVSSYLTFFETLHLLLKRGVLEMQLTDNLFRNRFFKAVGDPGILRTALIKDASSFAHVHQLIEDWYQYLASNGTPVHPGYYSYVRTLIEGRGYTLVRLEPGDADEVAQLVAKAGGQTAPAAPDLALALSGDAALGFRSLQDGRLVAAVGLAIDGTAPSRLVFALFDSEHRGAGLNRALLELLEERAAAIGATEIVCEPDLGRHPHRELLRSLRYKPGGRGVLRRALPAADTSTVR